MNSEQGMYVPALHHNLLLTAPYLLAKNIAFEVGVCVAPTLFAHSWPPVKLLTVCALTDKQPNTKNTIARVENTFLIFI